jgi:hypothetical protein
LIGRAEDCLAIKRPQLALPLIDESLTIITAVKDSAHLDIALRIVSMVSNLDEKSQSRILSLLITAYDNNSETEFDLVKLYLEIMRMHLTTNNKVKALEILKTFLEKLKSSKNINYWNMESFIEITYSILSDPKYDQLQFSESGSNI